MTLDHPQPTRQQLAAVGRTAPLKCTGKVKTALDHMVWQGFKRDDAATAAGLTVHGLREALKRPHVKAYYLEQCEVLRLSGRARRILRLEELSEQNDNLNAAVNAIKTLDVDDNAQQLRGGSVATPGLVVIIGAPSSVDAHVGQFVGKTVDATNTPMISEGDGGQGIRLGGGGGVEPSPRAGGHPGGKTADD